MMFLSILEVKFDVHVDTIIFIKTITSELQYGTNQRKIHCHR